MGAVDGRDVVVEHVLDLPAGRALVAEKVDREAPHAFPRQGIDRIA